VKNIFKENYIGPEGRHLSCLTQVSVKGSYDENKQISIHPTGRHKKIHLRQETTKDGKNLPITAGRNPSRKGKLAKRSKALDIRRRECTATRSSLRSGVNPEAYTIPGSMQ
jgi:hypothetical protein